MGQIIIIQSKKPIMELPASRHTGYYRQQAGLDHFYEAVLYTVTLKIVKSNDNVLSHTCV